MFDLKALGADMAVIVRDFVTRSLAVFETRLGAVEQQLRALPAGLKGDPGADGKEGPAGKPGDAGPKGDPGADGKQGPEGKPGSDGREGPQGKDGAPGAKGDPGADGRDGREGKDGRDGKDGLAGRDAADICPLPAIDPAKAYLPGTWASHAGGLWLARRGTEGMDGWACIVNGLAAAELELGDDQRTVTLSMQLSDGQTVRKSVRMPVMIYREIWLPGKYQQGDSVTRDGSTWVATKDTETVPGNDGSDWRLSCKRGRDGRDGLKGDKGDRGAEGRAGKDLTQLGPNGQKW
jgi:hypothetical protein